MPTVRIALVLLVLGGALAATAGDALALEDLAHVLPPETVVYARCAGYDTLLAELENSRFLRDGKFVANLYRKNTAKLLPELEEMSGIPQKVWQKHLKSIKGVHFALFGFGKEADDFDAIGIVEIADAEKVREMLRETLGERSTFAGEVAGAQVQAVESEEVTVYYAIHEGRLFITNRPERISAVLSHLAETPDKSLATAPAYRSGALDSGKGTTLFAYADMPRLFSMMENTMGRGELRMYNDMDKIVKLDGLKSACVTSGMNGCRGRAITDPAHPWLNVFRGTVGPTTLTSWFPPHTFMGLTDSGSVPEKWKRLKTYLTSNQFPFAAMVKKGLGEVQKMLGASIEEIVATMGDEWGFFFPILDTKTFRLDDGLLTFAVRIGDREKFDAILGKFLNSPVVKELEKEGYIQLREEYGGAEIIRGNMKGRDDGPCMAIISDTLLIAGDVRALKAAIDAKTTGEGMLSRSARYLEGLPRAPSKFWSFSLPIMLLMEKEWVPLLDLVHEEAVLAAAASEDPGRTELFGNGSIPAFVALLACGELLEDEYREPRQACIHNLNEVGKALKAYREANGGRDPQSLEALVPDYLESKELLVCPLDHGKEDVTCSYEHFFEQGEAQNQWSVEGWCPHRLHGRLVLRRSGRAVSTSEQSFLRSRPGR